MIESFIKISKLNIFIILSIIMLTTISYGMGNTHYLKNNWYNYDVSKVKEGDITSITFVEEEEYYEVEDYDCIWDIDNKGLKAYFTTDTDVVISIPYGDILKADRDSSRLFSFFYESWFNEDGEEVKFDAPDAKKQGKVSNLKRINNLELLDTTDVTDMSYMFYNLKNLEEIDVTHFDTKNVIDMKFMFCGLERIENIDIKNFNTKNVKDMQGMFSGLTQIEDLDISTFDTSKVIDANSLFSNCKNLKNLNIKNLNFINAEGKVQQMFEDCDNLSYIDFTNVTLPKNIKYLFSGIGSKGLNIYNIDAKNSTNMQGLFRGCRNLEILNIILNTENVEDMSYMFYECEKLNWLYTSTMDTKKVKDMSYMYANCKSLTEIDLKNFNTENVKDMTSMFANCRDLKKLDLSGFNTKKVESNKLYEMLLNLRGLEELDISSKDFILHYVDSANMDKGKNYNLSLKDLTSLKRIKMNYEIARKTYELTLFGHWKNVNTNRIYSILKGNNTVEHFINGEYVLVDSCYVSFEPKNKLNMYDMNIPKDLTLNTDDDIFKIDEDNNVYYNEAYTFNGWYLDKDFVYKVPQYISVDDNITLFAKLDVKKYKVSFNTNGGTDVLSQTIEYNDKATMPTTIPKKKNYKFIGWYKENLIEPFDFNVPIKEDVEVFAKYEFSY